MNWKKIFKYVQIRASSDPPRIKCVKNPSSNNNPRIILTLPSPFQGEGNEVWVSNYTGTEKITRYEWRAHYRSRSIDIRTLSYTIQWKRSNYSTDVLIYKGDMNILRLEFYCKEILIALNEAFSTYFWSRVNQKSLRLTWILTMPTN